MRLFAKDLGFPEAPVLLPDGSFLFVEMSPDKGCVTHISADGGSRRIVARTGRPNGLATDQEGFIWVAETAMRSLLKMTLAGEYQVSRTDAAARDSRFSTISPLLRTGSLSHGLGRPPR